MSNPEPIKIIADILSKEMVLLPERIFIYNDGRVLPIDSNLYLVLSIRNRPPYAVKNEFRDITIAGVQTFQEVTTMNVAEQIAVQIVSKDSSARVRAYEAQMSMASTYSQQQQEKYGFHISRIADVIDVSFLEKTTRLNRYDCLINILTAYEKIKTIDYYDKFPTGNNLYEA